MVQEQGTYVIGVDTGGTFTDIVALGQNGEVFTGKSPTTPWDYSIGVMNAIEEVSMTMEVSRRELLGRTRMVKHGSTVATNAVIVRGGAKVGLITTKGFEDTTLIMRAVGRVDGLAEDEIRHVTRVTKPEPIVPKELIRGVAERIDYTGDVLVPSQAVAREGVAHLYEGVAEHTGIVLADPNLTQLGRTTLERRGVTAADSLHLTWSSIFAQSGAMVEDWRERGYGSVDMEAATLYTVAQHFGFAATALLAVWDQLDADRSFLDPLSPGEQTRLDAANTAVFEAALEITLDSCQPPARPTA